ncbi:PLC-like phosphodiesterase [Hyaloraphidium curvatum]|nr:PLC-like phosphodiesterase [Hyaloraphidium curvatum]
MLDAIEQGKPERTSAAPRICHWRGQNPRFTLFLQASLALNVFWLTSFLLVLRNDELDFNANMAKALRLFPQPRVAGGPYTWVCVLFVLSTIQGAASLHLWPRLALPRTVYIAVALLDVLFFLWPCSVTAVFLWLQIWGVYDVSLWISWLCFHGPILHLLIPPLSGGLLIIRDLRPGSLPWVAASLFLATAVAVLSHPTVISLCGATSLVTHMDRNWTASKPALWAHAGGRAEAPENTVQAFGAVARNPSVYGIESDVVLSAGWEPFIMHDCRAIGRTTDAFTVFNATTASRPCFEWDISQINRLDAGSWFAPQFAGTGVPAFSDLLRVARESGKKVILDLKYGDSGPYAAFVTLRSVLEMDMLDQFVWLNYGFGANWEELYAPVFDYFGVRERMTFGMNAPAPEKWDSVLAIGPRNVTVVVLPCGAPASSFLFYRQRNVTVLTYTVNAQWLFSSLWLGSLSDGVISDDPAALADLAAPIHLPWDTFAYCAAASYLSAALFIGALAWPIARRRMAGATADADCKESSEALAPIEEHPHRDGFAMRPPLLRMRSVVRSGSARLEL